MNQHEIELSLQSEITQYAISKVKGMIVEMTHFNGPGNGILRLTVLVHMNGLNHNHTVTLFDYAAANPQGLKVGDYLHATGMLTNTKGNDDKWHIVTEVYDPKYLVQIRNISQERSDAIAAKIAAGRADRQSNNSRANTATQRKANQQFQTPPSQQAQPQQEDLDLPFNDEVPF